VGDCVAMMLEGKFLRIGNFEDVFKTDDERVRSFYDYNFINNT
jgi:phospholipid/cholesterol/gamma-HCH transport system ATP-binding protein